MRDEVPFLKSGFLCGSVGRNAGHCNSSVAIFAGYAHPNALLLRGLILGNAGASGKFRFESEHFLAASNLNRDLFSNFLLAENFQRLVEIADGNITDREQLVSNLEVGFFGWAFGKDLGDKGFAISIRTDESQIGSKRSRSFADLFTIDDRIDRMR